MLKNICFLLFSYFLCFNSFSQKENKIYKKGLKYLLEKDYDKALVTFKKVLKDDQNFIQAYIRIGDIYKEKDSIENALHYFLKANELDSQIDFLYLDIGNCYYSLQNYPLAKKYYLEGIKKDPNDWMLYSNLGGVYDDKDDFDSAIYYFSISKQLNPTEKLLDLDLARSYLGKSDFDRSLFHLAQFHEKYPENLHSLRIRGYAKYNKKQYTSAFNDLEHSLRLSEEKDTIDYYAHFYMGLVNLQLKQFSEAINQFNNSEKIKEYEELFAVRGEAKQYLTDYNGAIEDYKKALSINEYYAEIYDDLIFSFVDADKIEEGYSFFDQKINKNPKNPNNYYAKALLLSMNDSLQFAFNYMNKAIELDSINPKFYCMRAIIRNELGEENFMENEEKDDEGFYDKLRSEVLADYAAAINCDTHKQNSLEKRANYYFEEGEFDLVLQDLKRMYDIDSNVSAHYYILKGKIHLDKRELQAAADNFSKALELDFENADAHFELAKVYYRTKEETKFCFHIRKAVELGIDTVLIDRCN